MSASLITEWEAKIGAEKVSIVKNYIDTVFEIVDVDNNGVLTRQEFA